MHPSQVSCQRYDAKALFRKWDRVFITINSNFLAYGETYDKAVGRALGQASPSDANAVMPILGCSCSAVARDGKKFVVYVAFPATPTVPEQYFAFETPTVPEQYFAFETSDARDSFMRAVQAKSMALAAPSPSAFASFSTPAAAEVQAQLSNSDTSDSISEDTRFEAAKTKVTPLYHSAARPASTQEPASKPESQLTSPSVVFLIDLRRCCGSIRLCSACAVVGSRCQRRHQRGCAL